MVSEKTAKITILGAGSWGCATALALTRSGNSVTLWSHREESARKLAQSRRPEKLPSAELPETVSVTAELGDAISGAECVMFCVPAQKTAVVAESAAQYCSSDQVFVSLSKGIEKESLKRMTEILQERIPAATEENTAALSGPSHAEEVARSAPTTIVAASKSERTALWLQEVCSNSSFRVYRSSDVIGVEFGAAVKNIIAIAAGITQALNLGDNALGALVTRGLAEISRLGVSMGADPLTFSGLSGLGDLITTCFSQHSRNRKVGELIGKGMSLDQVLTELGMVAEGVDTCVSVRDLAARQGVEMPITEEIYRTLFEGKAPADALRDLMGRSLKEEIWS